ncbi:peptidoglycan-binding protein [Streptomyces sp. FBKL.4005]|uniref:peptidoglycan-binding domain-containing protein n=1 Tax=Streptomyces sp. FBKL.4005 TaxID=2015515 RepID=UPI0026D39B07
MPTPPDPEEPPPGPVPEPVRVVRLRRFDALAELMREFRPHPVTYEPLGPAPGPPPHHPPTRPTDLAEDDTQQLPPVAGSRPADLWPTSAAGPANAWPTDSGPVNARFTDSGPANARLTGPGPANARFTDSGPANARPTDPEPADARPAATPVQLAPAQAAPRFAPAPRRTAVAVAVVAAVVGFGCALLLPGRPQAAATAHPASPATDAPPAATAPAPRPPTASASPTARTPATDPDGPGTLRQGDTGPEVTGLQQRLLRIPDVYRDGSTHGTYDAALTEAVARFQLWYGISGDETGVYGDDTRRALESRTGFGDDA